MLVLAVRGVGRITRSPVRTIAGFVDQGGSFSVMAMLAAVAMAMGALGLVAGLCLGLFMVTRLFLAPGT